MIRRELQYHVGQPEWRAAVLGEAFRRFSHLAGPVTYTEFHAHLMRWLGLPEEKIGAEIMLAAVTLIRTGLFISDGLHEPTGEITFGAETRLSPSHSLTLHLQASFDEPFANDP